MFGWLSLLSLTDWRSLSCSSCSALLLMVLGYAIIVQRNMGGRTGSSPGDTHSPPVLQSGHGSRHMLGDAAAAGLGGTSSQLCGGH